MITVIFNENVFFEMLHASGVMFCSVLLSTVCPTLWFHRFFCVALKGVCVREEIENTTEREKKKRERGRKREKE